MSVFTQWCDLKESVPQKRLISVRALVQSRWLNFGIYQQLQTFKNIGNSASKFIKNFLWIPWIPYGIPKKFERVWNSRSVLKNT